MKAIVLGGTGFVGVNVRAALHAAGFATVAVSRTGAVPVDLTAPAGTGQLARLLAAERAGVVVNAAGRPWRSTPAEMVAGNESIVERMLDAVAAVGHPVRVVQLGSVHEYGLGAPGTAYREDGPAAPVTEYGRSKLRATSAVLRSGVDAVVLRVSNVCGRGTPPGSLLRTVADHLAAGATGHAAPIRFGSLRTWRDFVDVRDVAAAVVAAARTPVAGGQVVNVGRGEAVHARRLVDRMVELSGLPVRVVEGEGGDVEWQQLDVSKAARVLGWRPRFSLDDSLRELLDECLGGLPAVLPRAA